MIAVPLGADQCGQNFQAHTIGTMTIRADIRQTAVTFSATEPRRPFLVIVRAGDHSLHKNWMRRDASRQWDLLVDYYGKKPDYADAFADFINQGGVTKFPSVKAIDEANPGFLRSYRAIFFLDDDIDVAFGDIDRLFDVFMRCGLWLAQPSLTHDSYHTHQIVLHSPLFELRRALALQLALRHRPRFPIYRSEQRRSTDRKRMGRGLHPRRNRQARGKQPTHHDTTRRCLIGRSHLG